MELGGQVIQLSSPGPNGGVALAIVDYTNKTISYVEIIADRPNNNKVLVWEVQTYTQTGA